MSERCYLIAAVPAALRDVAQALCEPMLVSDGPIWSVPLVPLAGPADAAPTYYGMCAPAMSDGPEIAAAPILLAALPGGVYHVVTAAAYRPADDWHGRLAGHGLRVRQEVIWPT